MEFDFEVNYRPGVEQHTADTSLRASITENNDTDMDYDPTRLVIYGTRRYKM